MNMSYCRFQNTRRDLADCLDHFTDPACSPEEHKARLAILEMAKEIAALEPEDLPFDPDDFYDEDEDEE